MNEQLKCPFCQHKPEEREAKRGGPFIVCVNERCPIKFILVRKSMWCKERGLPAYEELVELNATTMLESIMKGGFKSGIAQVTMNTLKWSHELQRFRRHGI